MPPGDCMRSETKRPRDYAAEITATWLSNQPTEQVISGIPVWCRDLATTQARWSCRLIQYWAKRAMILGMDAVPKKMKPNVIAYWEHR